MTPRYLAIILVIPGLIGCSKNTDSSVTVSKIDSEKVYTIHLKEIKDSLTLHLADIVEDFEFIPLEAGDESMVSWGKCYVSNEYILVNQREDRILQFGRSGQFIRTLMHYGKGPLEYRDAGWTVDEENQILYISDIQKQRYFLRFDLRTGAYLGDLPKAGACSNYLLHINPDQSLMVIPAGDFSNDSIPSYIYWQNLEGHLIKAIEAHDTTHVYGVYPRFYPVGDDYRYFISGDDTVYTIRDLSKMPFLIIDYGEKNPPYVVDIGHQSFSINFETTRWLSLANHLTRINPGGTNPAGPMKYYILDKKAPRLYFQGSVLLDPTNRSLSFHSVESLTLQANGKFNYVYQAIDLIADAKKALADPGFKEPYRSKLKEIVGKITIEDNPVLLVGRVK